MKEEFEIKDLLLRANTRMFEKELGIIIRNGQAVEGIKAALRWVIKE